MKISDEIVDHIAHLSRLEFVGDDKSSIKHDLEKIIGFMSKLNELNTDNVDPLIFMSDELNRLRDDVPSVTISHEEALRNAPKKDSDYFEIRNNKVLCKTLLSNKENYNNIINKVIFTSKWKKH